MPETLRAAQITTIIDRLHLNPQATVMGIKISHKIIDKPLNSFRGVDSCGCPLGGRRQTFATTIDQLHQILPGSPVTENADFEQVSDRLQSTYTVPGLCQVVTNEPSANLCEAQFFAYLSAVLPLDYLRAVTEKGGGWLFSTFDIEHEDYKPYSDLPIQHGRVGTYMVTVEKTDKIPIVKVQPLNISEENARSTAAELKKTELPIYIFDTP